MRSIVILVVSIVVACLLFDATVAENLEQNSKNDSAAIIDGSAYVNMFLPKPENTSILPDKENCNPLKLSSVSPPPAKEEFWIENEATGK